MCARLMLSASYKCSLACVSACLVAIGTGLFLCFLRVPGLTANVDVHKPGYIENFQLGSRGALLWQRQGNGLGTNHARQLMDEWSQQGSLWHPKQEVQDGIIGPASAQAPAEARPAVSTSNITTVDEMVLHLPPEMSSYEVASNIWRLPPLPELPEEAGPWHLDWDNSVALCTTVRGENVTDMREWLMYYRWLGASHVFLTDNSPSPDAVLYAGIADFVESGFVTWAHESRPQAQLIVYRRCLEKQREHYNWLAFIDADEFLVIQQRNMTLRALLNEYRYFPGLGVHWVLMGPSGLDSRPELGGVLRHYQQCTNEPNLHVKMIANTYFVEHIAAHAHNMLFRGRGQPVNELRQPIASHNGDPKDRRGCSAAKCPLQAGAGMQSVPRHASVERIALFHYVTKSRQDFSVKRKRGGGSTPVGKEWKYFDWVARTANKTSELCQRPSELADDCCPEAQFAGPAQWRNFN